MELVGREVTNGSDAVVSAAVAKVRSAMLLDEEEPVPPAQQTMIEPPMRLLGGASGGGSSMMPASGDKLFSKLVCVSCGLGEVMGEAICGEDVQCFCIKQLSQCGIKGNCLAWTANGELYQPEPTCASSAKFFCLKQGVMMPDKPWVVCCEKTMA